MQIKKLQALVWKHKHRDFRSNTGGEKTIMINGGAQGSILVALSSLTEAQCMEQLPADLARAIRFSDDALAIATRIEFRKADPAHVDSWQFSKKRLDYYRDECKRRGIRWRDGTELPETDRIGELG